MRMFPGLPCAATYVGEDGVQGSGDGDAAGAAACCVNNLFEKFAARPHPPPALPVNKKPLPRETPGGATKPSERAASTASAGDDGNENDNECDQENGESGGSADGLGTGAGTEKAAVGGCGGGPLSALSVNTVAAAPLRAPYSSAASPKHRSHCPASKAGGTGGSAFEESGCCADEQRKRGRRLAARVDGGAGNVRKSKPCVVSGRRAGRGGVHGGRGSGGDGGDPGKPFENARHPKKIASGNDGASGSQDLFARFMYTS